MPSVHLSARGVPEPIRAGLDALHERLEVPVPTEAHGFHRLSAIIRNSSVDKRAGILDPVILIISSQGGPS